ncbi:siderophore-iron reductase FhuF [Shewanella xiamenensis]|uniref:Siderophore-iron reductase FhuF n=1 Tax=Shewanella xiamenensis TaxID=332186 RepID=A0AAE4PYK0_9GAMM|nr:MULTISPECIES: siderophore-iron reductase FhuF [Shewanella]MDH1625949.1 siderophore-iron reductase FhuF [Shewanella xiamenensis]MDI5835032.1 siderophore-iron reductase FhuF [Shewanella xiamenensis]MDI5839195.1 siderophore-iron reductase FhuF [Shewanella xiamenensis]MDI5843250.1 siderophore-iron reductase FhuF [Shewanella xiamenensis]MDI5847843.1 siderophore-iron reductase FhuF [Shewanella xiamenensis]
MARQRETLPTLAKLSRGTQPEHTKQCHHKPSQSLGTVVGAQTTDLTALSQVDLTEVAQEFNQRLALRAPFYAQHFVATTKPQGLNIDTWSQPAVYQSLLLDFAKAYPPLGKTSSSSPSENIPEQILLSHSCNSKALHSLWGQWYFGLLVPPMLEWIINAPHSLASTIEQIELIDIVPEHFYLRPHNSGRVAGFEFQLTPTPKVKTAIVKAAIVKSTVVTPPRERQLIKWIQSHLIPSVERLTGLSPTPAKLYWSHLGYLIHWYLGEMALPEIEFEHLKALLFNTTSFDDGEVNPLYNSINLLPAPVADVGNIRRVCCLRYQLTNSHRCGDCPLATRAQAKCAAHA